MNYFSCSLNTIYTNRPYKIIAPSPPMWCPLIPLPSFPLHKSLALPPSLLYSCEGIKKSVPLNRISPSFLAHFEVARERWPLGIGCATNWKSNLRPQEKIFKPIPRERQNFLCLDIFSGGRGISFHVRRNNMLLVGIAICAACFSNIMRVVITEI